jgi:hypothetical protein
MIKNNATLITLLILNTFTIIAQNIVQNKNGSELAKYEKLYIWETPENPYKKTPIVSINEEDIVPRLKNEYPRMFMTKDRINELRNQVIKDTLLQKYTSSVIDQANKMIKQTSIKNDRELQKIIFSLGFAYHWTGKVIYAETATKLLTELCERPEWDWFHFLGGSEATLVAGAGFDIFYNYFDNETRNKIRHNIIKNGLNHGIAAYNGAPFGWFRYVRHNWNLVCNSGMLIGALSIAGDDYHNYYANKIVPAAVKSMSLALNEYAPDGAYPEGPGYSGFATSYTILALEAMYRSLGTDFNLSKFEGFDQNFYYNMYVTAPNGKITSYADCSSDTYNKPNGLMMWNNDPFLVNREHNMLSKSKLSANVYDILFYHPLNKVVSENIPLDRYFRGPVEVVSMRNNWNNPNASFLQIKAGYNQVNHGHLDLGAFEYFSLGEKWFYDLGSDEYLLPDYFDMNGGRWKYFRTSSLSHNVPVINNNNQYQYANSKFTEVDINKSTSIATVDLTDAYKDFCNKMNRKILFDKKNETIIMQDYYETLNECNISWRGLTNANIKLNGNTAILTQNNKTINLKILSPNNAKFTIESAEQSSPEKLNKGVKILKIEFPAQKGINNLKLIIKKN